MNVFIYIYLLIAILAQAPPKTVDSDMFKFMSSMYSFGCDSWICGTQGIVILNFTFTQFLFKVSILRFRSLR